MQRAVGQFGSWQHETDRKEQGLAPYVTRPLKVKEDLKANRYFIASEYNCDAGSHRSPWSDRYIPAPPGGEAEEEKLFRPSARLGPYATSYYEGAVSSVYLWDLEEGYAGAFLIRKELPKIFGDGKSGVWDAVHIVEVGPVWSLCSCFLIPALQVRDSSNSNYVDFKLSSTIVLHVQVSPKGEQTELSAHLTRQAESRLDRRKKSGEDAQIIQDNENFLRRNLECIHMAKQHTILDSMRIPFSEPKGPTKARIEGDILDEEEESEVLFDACRFPRPTGDLLDCIIGEEPWQNAETADGCKVRVVGDAAALKRLFELPLQAAGEALCLHRVGDCLVVLKAPSHSDEEDLGPLGCQGSGGSNVLGGLSWQVLPHLI
eukprot:symbB.v1.2.041513.t1/scaffold8303.1/size9326/1